MEHDTNSSSAQQQQPLAPTHPGSLLSADDLDYGGNWSGREYSLHTSTSSDEANIHLAQEEALCEEVEYYLELEKQNADTQERSSGSPERAPNNNITPEEPPRSRSQRKVFTAPKPARKPLRRPKPETIAKLNACSPNSEYIYLPLSDSVLQINSRTGKGYWVGTDENPKEAAIKDKICYANDSYNSTGNSLGEHCETQCVPYHPYGDPSTACYRDQHAFSESVPSADNLSLHSSDRSGSTADSNQCCEGAGAADFHSYRYRDSDRVHKPYEQPQGTQRWGNQNPRRRYDPNPDRQHQRRRSAPSHTAPLSTQQQNVYVPPPPLLDAGDAVCRKTTSTLPRGNKGPTPTATTDGRTKTLLLIASTSATNTSPDQTHRRSYRSSLY